VWYKISLAEETKTGNNIQTYPAVLLLGTNLPLLPTMN